SAARRLGVAPGHGPDRDAERLGQLAMGWQAVARGQTATRDVVGQRVGQREVERPRAVPQVRGPTCHGDNLAIDSRLCQYYFYCVHHTGNWYRYNRPGRR